MPRNLSDAERERLAERARELHRSGRLDAREIGRRGGLASGEARRRAAAARQAPAEGDEFDRMSPEEIDEAFAEMLRELRREGSYERICLAGDASPEAAELRALAGIDFRPVVDQRRWR